MNLNDEQKKLLAHTARETGAVFIVEFGSAARGQARPESDLDIAVLSRHSPDYHLFGKAFSLLSDVFPGKNVDLRFLNGADPLFTMQVVRDGILLYGDADAYDDFKMLANRRYIDDGAIYFSMHRMLIVENQKRLEATIHD